MNTTQYHGIQFICISHNKAVSGMIKKTISSAYGTYNMLYAFFVSK